MPILSTSVKNGKRVAAVRPNVRNGTDYCERALSGIWGAQSTARYKRKLHTCVCYTFYCAHVELKERSMAYYIAIRLLCTFNGAEKERSL